MAGSRIQGGFASYAGIEYDIFIYDAEFVASLSTNPNVMGDPGTGDVWGWESDGGGNVWGWSSLDELENPPGLQVQKVALPGFRLEYETQNEGVYTPLMPSRLSFSLFFENQTHETFLNAIANSYEGQFLVRVLRSGELFWTGVLMPDVVQYEDADYPYTFEFVAVDGLTRLKSIEYPNAVLIGDTRETFFDIMYTCLGQLETLNFWEAGDEFFINNVNWWELRHVADYIAEPLKLTRVKTGSMYEENSRTGAIEFLSCYQMLEQICTVIGARLYLSAGSWHMMQPEAYKNSVQSRRVYAKSKALIFSTGGQSYEILCDQKEVARTKGRYEFLAPVKRADITYRSRSVTGTLIPGASWDWITDGNVVTIGDISDNNGTAKIKIRIEVEHTYRFVPYADMPDPSQSRHLFAMQLRVGAYYFVGNEDDGAAWTTTPGVYVFYTAPFRQWENNTSILEVTTSELPATGACTFSFAYKETQQLPPLTPTVLPLQISTIFDLVPEFEPSMQYWTAANPLLIVLDEGNESEAFDFTIYRAENANTTNSKIIERLVFLGDGPFASSNSRIQTFDGSAWGNSTLWGLGIAGARNKRLLELLASRIVAVQDTPRIKYVGQLITTTLRGFYDPYHRLKIGNRFYIFLGGAFEAVSDTWADIHLFNIKTEIDPITSIIVKD